MLKTIIAILLSILLVTACAQSPASLPAPATDTPSVPAEPAHIDVGVGFVPNIQFAPLYVAQAKGFFADEGLDVSLEYGFENDFVALTATGERQFAVASGDQVILARSQGLPVVYVAKWYQRYPVGIASLAEANFNAPADLQGATVGIPGLYGASFTAWKGLVYAAGLDESTIHLREIGFTQAEALSQRQVDAAVVYLANEPVQLAQAGQAVAVFEVSDYLNLVSNGLITNETVIRQNPDLVRRLVRGFLRGLQYTIDHPDEAFDLSRPFIADMADEDAPTQRKVLEASIALWQSNDPGLSNRQDWVDSVEFMRQSGLIEADVDVDSLFSNDFVEK